MKFAYTLLYVQSTRAAADFYHKAFGFEIGYVGKADMYIEMVTGGTKLGFVDAAFVAKGMSFNQITPSQPAPGMEIAFATDDVQKAYDAALAHGATAVCEPTQKPWGQTVAHVRDLDGFLVELCTPMG